MSRETRVEDIVPTRTYAAYRINNLRTGQMSQFAYVSGMHAVTMLAKSTEPGRLVFVDTEPGTSPF